MLILGLGILVIVIIAALLMVFGVILFPVTGIGFVILLIVIVRLIKRIVRGRVR